MTAERAPARATSDDEATADAGTAHTRHTTGWLPWLLLAVVAVGALVVGTLRDNGPQTAQDRVTGLAQTIKCPTCKGESVAESNAASSREIRRDIAERVQQGQTDEQIRAYYADRYGLQILLTPPRSGVGALVWIIPVVVSSAALAGLVVVFRRWRVRPSTPVTDRDRDLVARALAANDDQDTGTAAGAEQR